MSFTWICFLLLDLCSMIPKIAWSQDTRTNFDSEYGQNSRQNLLSVDKFHYLNVPRIDIITPYDDFECILKCLDHPLCVSVNGAAEGKKWCELLSTNKFNDPDKLKESKSWHHYSSFKFPCSSNPCQNGGACVVAKHKLEMFECICKNGYSGEFCEKIFPAVQLQNCSQAPKKTGIYNIFNHGSGPFPVYCDQTTDGGGWMMIFKVIGGINSSFSAGEFWNSSDTFSENVTAVLDTTSSYRGNYKNRIVQSWQMFSPIQARVALYTNGTEVVSIIFSAKGTTHLNWFSQKNLIQSPWTDLRNAKNIFPFHINGHYKVRSFEITASYGGCELDSGWLVITGPYCGWERRQGVVPGILYSKKTHNITWNYNQADVGVAEVMIVYIR